MSLNRNNPPKPRPGYRWEYRTGCYCDNCPVAGNCKGETFPHWIEVATKKDGA